MDSEKLPDKKNNNCWYYLDRVIAGYNFGLVAQFLFNTNVKKTPLHHEGVSIFESHMQILGRFLEQVNKTALWPGPPKCPFPTGISSGFTMDGARNRARWMRLGIVGVMWLGHFVDGAQYLYIYVLNINYRIIIYFLYSI